jgi:hypothetical protein
MLAVLAYLGLAAGVFVAAAIGLMILLSSSAQLGRDIAVATDTRPPPRALNSGNEVSASAKTTGSAAAAETANKPKQVDAGKRSRAAAASKRKKRSAASAR